MIGKLFLVIEADRPQLEQLQSLLIRNILDVLFYELGRLSIPFLCPSFSVGRMIRILYSEFFSPGKYTMSIVSGVQDYCVLVTKNAITSIDPIRVVTCSGITQNDLF